MQKESQIKIIDDNNKVNKIINFSNENKFLGKKVENNNEKKLMETEKIVVKKLKVNEELSKVILNKNNINNKNENENNTLEIKQKIILKNKA